MASSAFAVPDGATVEVDPGTTKSYTVGGVDVFPAQPDVVDAVATRRRTSSRARSRAPFTIDKDAYQEDALVPAEAGDGDVLGTSRDLDDRRPADPGRPVRPGRRQT